MGLFCCIVDVQQTIFQKITFFCANSLLIIKYTFFIWRNNFESSIFYFRVLLDHISLQKFYCRRKHKRHRAISGRIKFDAKKILKNEIFEWALSRCCRWFMQHLLLQKCCFRCFQQILTILCMYTQRHIFFITSEFWSKISIISWIFMKFRDF